MRIARLAGMLVACFFAGTLARAAVAPVEAVAQDSVTVKTGRIEGTMLSLEDNTPVADATIRFLDGAGEVVAEAATDAQGRYVIAHLSEGRYTVQVAGALSGTLISSPQGTVTMLRMLIPPPPHQMPRPPAPKDGGAVVPFASTGAGLGAVNWTTVMVSTGISLAVAIPAGAGIAEAMDDDSIIQVVSP